MSPGNQELNFEGIERQPLSTFTEKAYLDYSMYVILDRALPALGDGLKPVQRRIVYAMSELGLSAVSKHKKSARTVGDVLGKFHPHGDTACYEAMVLMAQPFSYRYPLVDGQGNFGSPDDPKSFAAMRYTEARLTPFAEVLLAELEQGTVDWEPNFDGTLHEPAILPARLPYQVSGAKVLEQIATQMRAKKLPLLDDLRDESDHENPTRLVLVLHSAREDVAALMAHLFASTDLERTYRVNLNVIGLNERPQ